MSTLAAPLASPLYEGTGVSSTVPYPWDVAINGRPYQVNFDGDLFRFRSIPILRQQQDTSSKPGEQSINPAGLWRRTAKSWHRGAGQTYFDGSDDADEYRFRSSKGIDCWTRRQIGLLPDTAQKRASANTNLQAVPVGNNLYLADGNEVYRTTDLAVWTATNVLAVDATTGPVQSIATDGYDVWAVVTDGIHASTRGAGAWTHLVNQPAALTFNLLGYVKGRLMAAAGPNIYNITSAGLPAAPAALFPHPNTDFRWVGFAEGNGRIYAAGWSGDKSEVYRIGIKADGTGLDAAIPATPGLPDGEVVRSIANYLGYILLGTDKGVRFCETNGDSGDLEIGELIEIPNPVRCFEGQDRFVWFGWTNYDGVSTGLGRLDLTQFIATRAPAYASDLMAAAQGNVLSVATFAGKLVFTVSGSGVWAETADKTPSGTIDSGFITFDIADRKVGVFLDVRHEPLYGSHKAYVAGDGGVFTQIGSDTAPLGTIDDPYPVGQLQAEKYEVRHELVRSASETTKAPTVTRHTLRANPAADSGLEIRIPVNLHRTVKIRETEYPVDVLAELVAIDGLRTSGRVVTCQLLTKTYQVIVTDLEWIPAHRNTGDTPIFEGLALVTVKTVS